ncbi:MAG: hypothetical protein JWQ09_5898 [Segetibacter sp.]|nr:hypothetical protein [Segetibacter sp.]
MATLLSATVIATPDGALPATAQYLFSFGTVTRIKGATAKQKVTYPAANSVIAVLRPLNNSHESVEYIVAETLATLAAL